VPRQITPFQRECFWPYFAGIAILTIGLPIVLKNELPEAHGLDQLMYFGRVFFAISLAVIEGGHTMRYAFSLTLLGTLLFAAAQPNPRRTAVSQPANEQSPAQPAGAKASDAQAPRTPVIVELFTSEGCSSCPPADSLLSKLETDQPVPGAEVIALEEHVDYWNHDGWTDSYSSPDWTLRQQEYVTHFKGQTPFTPQMVVDGQRQFVGNSTRDAIDAITASAHQTKAQISITPVPPAKGDSERIAVQVANLAAMAGQEAADVWMAITEEGLGTDVKAGENAGKTVQHAAIVRSLHKIGAAPATGSSPFVTNQQVKFKSNWKKENLHIVVFVQERKSLRILGAASAHVAS
jgi:hypothetical protein